MKKALLVANAASMIKLFNQLNMAILQSMDYEIHVACNLYEGNTISSEEVNRKHIARFKLLHCFRYLRFYITLARSISRLPPTGPEKIFI